MFPNGVKVFKWPYESNPTQELVQLEMQKYGYSAYDLQTIPPWFKRSAHAHDYEEIRAAVEGCITFHFDDYPITIEAGDIIIIPAHLQHTVILHNSKPFIAFKGNKEGKRKVTELGDGKGSVEHLESLKS
jgi:cupin superfamily acireductone dioxygenase involved in methionine salvage